MFARKQRKPNYQPIRSTLYALRYMGYELRILTYEKITLFMQNKPKLPKARMNLTHYSKESYNDLSPLPTPKNKPKQSQIKAKTNPKQSQNKPNSNPNKSKIPRGAKQIEDPEGTQFHPQSSKDLLNYARQDSNLRPSV